MNPSLFIVLLLSGFGFGFVGCGGPEPSAPSSSLEYMEAGDVAAMVAEEIDGRLIAFADTDSMLPALDYNAFGVLEDCDFSDLRAGDVVSVPHPFRRGVNVCHAITAKDSRGWWLQGWNSSQPDRIQVTRENFRGRLVAIVYSEPF